MFIPSNNLAKLAIGAGQAVRLELADQLYYPVAVDFQNPGQPMAGGPVGNRAGQPTQIDAAGVNGNTAGFAADFSNLTGDPVSMIRTKTSDGIIFQAANYTGKGIVTIEDPEHPNSTGGQYTNIPRYIVKADGIVYDLLQIRGQDAAAINPAPAGPYQHWEFAAANAGSGYAGATNTYTPGAATADPQYPGVTGFAPNQITSDYYVRPVGYLTFRDKSGASSGFIQEQLTRAQSSLDSLSRFLRTLHDESKGAFSNIVVR